jgi:hypothetical protein
MQSGQVLVPAREPQAAHLPMPSVQLPRPRHVHLVFLALQLIALQVLEAAAQAEIESKR